MKRNLITQKNKKKKDSKLVVNW